MRLFEKSVDYQPKLSCWRDTSARFLHDLATNGMPMSLASLKATCDAVSEETRVDRTRGTRLPRSLRLLQPAWPFVGVAEACLSYSQ